jgi:hypothetical protein
MQLDQVCLVIHKESGLFVGSKITSISGLNGSDSIRFYLQTNMSSLWGLSELFFLLIFSPFNLASTKWYLKFCIFLQTNNPCDM